MASESIILDGQQLSGEDHYGEWTTNGLDGWWSSPEPKGEDVPRENADGDHETPVYYEARYITLTGSLRAKSHEQQHQAITRFNGLVLQRSVLQIAGHGVDQWINVVRASALKIEPITDTYSQWQARVKARNPRKFGAARSVAATAGAATPIQNRGNYPASPVIVVAGPVSAGGYTITGPGGEVFTVTTSPAAGVTHLINMHDGLLRVNGSIAAGAGLVSRAATFTIPPGGRSNVTLSKGGRVELYDTYI